MSERREAIAVGVLLAALLIIGLLVRPHAREMAGSDPRVSSFRTGPTGARALYLLADELDLPVRRSVQPWYSDTAAGVLVVLGATEQATPREVAALRAWLNDGGTLIFAAARARDPLRRIFGLSLAPPDDVPEGGLERARWTGATAVPTSHAWTAGIDSVAGFTQVFQRSAVLQYPSAEVLLETPDGEPAVVTFASGNGRVVAWSDAAPLSNQALRDGGAALLFARAASATLESGGVLTFDEFHHGYRQGSPWRALQRFVTRTRPGRAVLQVAAAVALLLLLAGTRFGAPAADAIARRRSPLEHVEAVAGAYRRADARRTTRRLLVAGLERRIGRRLVDGNALNTGALPQSRAVHRLAEEWARDDGGDLVALAQAIDDCIADVRRPR